MRTNETGDDREEQEDAMVKDSDIRYHICIKNSSSIASGEIG